MSLLLSSADILRLNEAAHILLSPFAFENGTAWRREAGRVIAPLVNASHAFSGMTVEGEEFWSGDEQDVRGLSSLPIPDFVYRGAVQLVRQPPRMYCTGAGALDRKRWPCPTGNAYTA